MGDSILASAATSASYNMLLQLLFRILTFILNAFVLRHVSRDMLGVVNVRLTLLYSTTLFLSREAFRRACLSKSTDRRWPQVINLLWCTIPLGILCTSALGGIWIYLLEPPDPTVVPYYEEGVLMFALSTVIEMLAEPLWVVGQVLLFVRLRVIVEGFALASRCILTVIFILVFPSWGLLAFSLAQVLSTCIYTCLYYGYFVYITRCGKVEGQFPFQSLRDFFPRSDIKMQVFSIGLTSLTWSFFKQTVLKQLLTEGERYMMTIFNILSFADQGIYDVINNLGSLAARFIFLPLEDAAYLLFSHTLERGVPLKLQSKDHQELSSCVLECLLKFVVLVGMTILIFGITNAELALDLYGGSILSTGSGPNLLRWYSFYVLMIAMNGVTESFVFASMSKDEVDKYNHKMFGFSLLFLVSSWYLTQYFGSVGFILANCLNMAARITHSIHYIINYYKETPEMPLWGLLPYRPVLMAYGSAFATTFTSMRLFCCSRGFTYRVAHVAISAGSLFVVLLVIYFTEKPLVDFFSEQWYKHRAKAETNDKAKIKEKEKVAVKQD